MSSLAKKIIKWAVTLAFALVLTLVFYACDNAVYKQVKPQTVICCDALFSAAVIYLAAAGFALISKHGGFDTFSFAAKKIGGLFARKKSDGENAEVKSESYFDYTQERKRRKDFSVLHILVTGGFLLALSLVLLFFC